MFIHLLFLLVSARAQTFDLYEAPQHMAPVLVFAHGGAWRTGNKGDYRPWGEKMAKLGICVAVMDYRKSREAKHPAPIEDLRKVVANIKNSKCDTDRLYLAGHSAGAHMVAYWNTEYRDKRVRGLIGIEGIYDIPKMIAAYPKYRDWFIKDEFGENLIAASPSRRTVKDKIPWLVIHSKKDELITPDHSKLWVDALENQKVKVEYLLVDEGNHFGVIESLPTNEAGRAILKFMGLHPPTTR